MGGQEEVSSRNEQDNSVCRKTTTAFTSATGRRRRKLRGWQRHAEFCFLLRQGNAALLPFVLNSFLASVSSVLPRHKGPSQMDCQLSTLSIHFEPLTVLGVLQLFALSLTLSHCHCPPANNRVSGQFSAIVSKETFQFLRPRRFFLCTDLT